MSFQSRNEFINSQASEKLTLVHVEATTRLVDWTSEGSDLYSKVPDFFVVAISTDTSALTQVSTLGAVVAGTFFYDIPSNILYIKNASLQDPATVDMVTTYRFFFSNGPVTASWDLTNTGERVMYDGRIKKSPGYKHEVGIEQNLTSLVGSGSLVLNNNDGHFDDFYDKLFFENHNVTVFSWSRSLDFDQSKIIFRGKTTNKSFSSDAITLKIKDSIFDLQQNVPQTVYDDTDSVNSSVKGTYKRWIYGRVDGLKLQSVDQIGDGYDITGTIEGTTATATLTGTGTLFLSEVSPGDTLKISTQEFTIESVASDTSLVVGDNPTFAFSALTGSLVPEIPTVVKNRDFFVADHICTELTKQVVSVKQFNRIELSDTIGLLSGDFVEFDTAERIEIKSVAPDNVIVLQQNVITKPTVNSDVVRQPVQSVLIESNLVSSENFTLSNIASGLVVTLDTDAEFDLARVEGLVVNLTFTNGSRTITSSSTEDLTGIVKPRDWVRPSDLSFSTFYEVLDVTETTIILRVPFADANETGTGEIKRPNYVGDETIVSANVLGRTEDGTASGTWISTAAQAITDVLSEINVTDINTASFAAGALTSPQVVSLPIPFIPSSSGTPVKDVVDALNQSTLSSITLDNNLDIKYNTLFVDIDDDLPVITDKERITWSVTATNGNLYRNSIIRYRHKDVDRFTQEQGNNVVSFSSEFVQKYIGTDKTIEIDARLYDSTAAQIRGHREVYYNRLSRAKITLEGDLRLDTHEIGDAVKLNFRRLYKRLGDNSSREKILTIMGKSVTGERVTLILTDLGNIYNTSSIITPNTAPDFSAAVSTEKIKYGYITDEQGIIGTDDDTSNIHLIS